MQRTTRRGWLKGSLAGGVLLGLTGSGGARPVHAAGPNSEVRIAIIGLGGMDVVGGVGGRGRQLLGSLSKVPGARVAAVCDVDEAVLGHEVGLFQKRTGGTVAAVGDLRRVLDDKNIDAVAIATPNHWHALATVWACQAGKDVYVEKPFCYNIWEGRQIVAAARKYRRIVQVGTQRRSSTVLRRGVEYLRSGAIGPVHCAYALVYRPREGMAKVSTPTPVPRSVNYDLWCGPAPMAPLMRKQLHYDWHWFWSTGNGEIGNNGVHQIDVCRWMLGEDQLPPRAISIGGRFAFDDGGETPNTQVAFLDYQPAPLICEVRNVQREKGSIGRFRNAGRGVVVVCEGGYFAETSSGGAIYDRQGKMIREIRDAGKSQDMEVLHLANFVGAVRSRNAAALNAESIQGHLSAGCAHMANISHRLGTQSSVEQITEIVRSNRELSDAFERCNEYLRANGIRLAETQAVMGPWLTFDPGSERFVGEFADRANELCQRTYRKPFVVPEIA